MREANLLKANLEGTNLQHTDLRAACLEGVYLYSANLNKSMVTPKQISNSEGIRGVKYLSKEFLVKVKQLNPEIIEWWHKEMVKEIYIDGYWTGRWIEPPINQADKQSER